MHAAKGYRINVRNAPDTPDQESKGQSNCHDEKDRPQLAEAAAPKAFRIFWMMLLVCMRDSRQETTIVGRRGCSKP
ncbi:MAG TPA: hypothetical protein VH325_12270 [Bryobacteraceae bacterium]|jgi:hypothetical protein|nr:hypothetical protein [Bryobacteraceae bacterium]